MEAKVITLPKPDKEPEFPQNLLPIRLLSTTDKLFAEVILQIVQRHTEERGQIDFRASQSTTVQCTKLTDHVTLNFNNKIFTAAVFLNTEKAFDIIWHFGLLYKLPELKFSISLFKVPSSLLSQKKFRVAAEG
jgi:hypothetical protein